MTKVWVIGTPGSGKSTFSYKLSSLSKIECITLDNLKWKENWVKENNAIFVKKVDTITDGNNWIVDGFYPEIVTIMSKADAIVYMNCSVIKALFRVTKRSYKRIRKKQIVFNGNQENWRFFFSKSGIFLYTISEKIMYKRYIKEISKINNNIIEINY